MSQLGEWARIPHLLRSAPKYFPVISVSDLNACQMRPLTHIYLNASLHWLLSYLMQWKNLISMEEISANFFLQSGILAICPQRRPSWVLSCCPIWYSAWTMTRSVAIWDASGSGGQSHNRPSRPVEQASAHHSATGHLPKPPQKQQPWLTRHTTLHNLIYAVFPPLLWSRLPGLQQIRRLRYLLHVCNTYSFCCPVTHTHDLGNYMQTFCLAMKITKLYT